MLGCSTLTTEESELINADVALSGCNTRTVLRLHLDDKRTVGCSEQVYDSSRQLLLVWR